MLLIYVHALYHLGTSALLVMIKFGLIVLTMETSEANGMSSKVMVAWVRLKRGTVKN